MQKATYSSPIFWKWVKMHINENPDVLRLSKASTHEVDVSEAITQIECRCRFGKKLSATLASFPDFYFPSTLAGEQCTSDLLADYHKRFVSHDDSLVDLTSGLGIDVTHLATVVQKATAVEHNHNLAAALSYNAKGLGIENIRVCEGDCRQLVKELNGTVAFIDPARRAADGSRVFGLKDCEPDVTELCPALCHNFKRLIVKASPMLDIAQTIADLPGTTDIYALGTKTECKELVVLVDFEKDAVTTPVIHAVTIGSDNEIEEFAFTRNEEAESIARIGSRRPTVGDLLYVPYPATMKAAPVKLLATRFNLEKFHANTHLYFGSENKKAGDFPGEIFEILDVLPWQSKVLKRFKSSYPNVMVSVRNFGMSAEALRAKLGVKEGGKERLRLFGIGLGNNHTDRILVVARECRSVS